MIDDIYRAIDGDEYLLWYKVRLLAMGGHNREALQMLSEMETRYNVDVTKLAATQLPAEFRASADYKAWEVRYRQLPARKPF